jgi:hypothetical protein
LGELERLRKELVQDVHSKLQTGLLSLLASGIDLDRLDLYDVDLDIDFKVQRVSDLAPTAGRSGQVRRMEACEVDTSPRTRFVRDHVETIHIPTCSTMCQSDSHATLQSDQSIDYGAKYSPVPFEPTSSHEDLETEITCANGWDADGDVRESLPSQAQIWSQRRKHELRFGKAEAAAIRRRPLRSNEPIRHDSWSRNEGRDHKEQHPGRDIARSLSSRIQGGANRALLAYDQHEIPDGGDCESQKQPKRSGKEQGKKQWRTEERSLRRKGLSSE